MLLLYPELSYPEATVYRDDGSDLRFYILPNVPILRRYDDGKAVMKYVKYRTLKPMANGDVGAALVFMDVELALTPAQEQSLRAKSGRNGQSATRRQTIRGRSAPTQIELAQAAGHQGHRGRRDARRQRQPGPEGQPRRQPVDVRQQRRGDVGGAEPARRARSSRRS